MPGENTNQPSVTAPATAGTPLPSQGELERAEPAAEPAVAAERERSPFGSPIIERLRESDPPNLDIPDL